MARVTGSSWKSAAVRGPSMPGIITSSSTTSGGSSRATRCASGPLTAVMTCQPPDHLEGDLGDLSNDIVVVDDEDLASPQSHRLTSLRDGRVPGLGLERLCSRIVAVCDGSVGCMQGHAGPQAAFPATAHRHSWILALVATAGVLVLGLLLTSGLPLMVRQIASGLALVAAVLALAAELPAPVPTEHGPSSPRLVAVHSGCPLRRRGQLLGRGRRSDQSGSAGAGRATSC